MEVIRVKEEVELKESKWRAAIKTMENERSDLRFVISKKDFKIQQLDSDVLRLKEKLDTVLAKNYLPSSIEIDMQKKENVRMQDRNILGRKQGFEITHTLPPENKKPQDENEKIQEKKEGDVWAEELRAADDRANKFKQQADTIEKELGDTKKSLISLKKQVETRDVEIKRLQGLYEGGQNIEKLASKYANDNNEQLISRLNSHIDFLNKENHRLENELRKIKPEDRFAATAAESTQQLRASQLIKKNEIMANSVKELEKTVDILQKEKQAFEEKMKELEKAYIQKIESEQIKNAELEKDVGALEIQLSDKQKEMEISTNVKAAFTSDKKAYADALEVAKKEVVNLTRANRELNENLGKLRGQLEEARSNLNVQMGKSANATREAEMAHATAGKAESEYREQAEESTKLRQRVHELETELLGLKNDRANQKFEIDRLVKQKYSLEEQLMAFKNEALKKKTEAEGSGATASRLEGLYNSAKAEIDYLKKDNEQLDKLLIQQKEKVAELDKQARDYYLELTRVNENYKTLQQEHQMLSNELSGKVAEIRKSENSRVQLERKLTDLKSYEEHIKSLTSQSQKYIQENVKTENEKLVLQDNIKKLEGQIAANEGIINDLNTDIGNLKSANDALQAQLNQLQEENIIAKTKSEKMKIAERDLQSHKDTLEVVHKKEIDLAKQLEDNKAKLSTTQLECANAKKKAEGLEIRVKELESDNKLRLDENIGLRLRLNDQERKANVGEQQQKGLAIQSEEINKILQGERKEKEKLEKDLRNLGKELENSRVKEVVLKEQIDKLKGLVENLDNTKDELMNKLKSSTQVKKSEETEKMNLIKDIEKLKADLLQKEQEANDAKNSLNDMDATMDKLQGELDKKTEELEKTKLELIKITKEYQQLHAKTDQQSTKEDSFNKRIVERENEIREIGQKLMEVSKELEDTKEMLYYKNKELENLSNDIQVLTKENQFINAELMRLNQAREGLKKMNDDLQQKEKGAQQTLRASELERDDILHSYKMVCEENERLNENANMLANENKEMIAKLQEYEKELYARGMRIQGLEQNEKKYIADIQGMERQINNLTKELEKAAGAMQENEEIKQSMLGDIENAKQVSFTLEANKEELQKTINDLDNAKVDLEQKLIDTIKQKELLKTQIEQEKARYTELELILAKERNIQHDQHLQIQNLEKEKNELKGNLNILSAKAPSNL